MTGMTAIERLHFLAGAEPATHEEIEAALAEAKAEGFDLGRDAALSDVRSAIEQLSE